MPGLDVLNEERLMGLQTHPPIPCPYATAGLCEERAMKSTV